MDGSSSKVRDRHVVRWGLVPLLAVCSLFVVGCSTHDEAVSNPCKLTEAGKLVVRESRGAMGLAKVGLTSEGLKAQEACK